VTIVFAELPPVEVPQTAAVVRADTRSYWLESLDGSVRVPFDNQPVSLVRGAVGLDVAPTDVAWSTTPGVEGGFVDESRTVPRPVLLPLAIVADSQPALWAAKGLIRQVVRPGESVTAEGAFNLVCSSLSGTRQLTCVYLSGLEGVTRVPHYDRFALELLAVDPFARDRTERVVEFTLGDSTGSMVSADPATAGPRQLGSSVVIGDAMPIDIVSGIPVWPRIDFTGPFSPLTVSASTGMSISVPGGVPAGQTLTVVTDPRNKSIRLDGALAAGMVARGSKVGAPFLPGLNHLSVAATGATSASRIVLSWRGGWRSLFN
jgi:hypothetical protein